MLNRCFFIGRVTRKPELRATGNKVLVTTFSIACERDIPGDNGQRSVDYVDIVAWRRLAETCAEHLDKGRLVLVEGRLQVRSYETQDGQKRRATEVIADRVDFLDHPKAAPTKDKPTAKAQADSVGEDVKVEEDDIPF